MPEDVRAALCDELERGGERMPDEQNMNRAMNLLRFIDTARAGGRAPTADDILAAGLRGGLTDGQVEGALAYLENDGMLSLSHLDDICLDLGMAPDEHGEVRAPAWLYEGVLRDLARNGQTGNGIITDEMLANSATRVRRRHDARIAAGGADVVRTAPPPSFSVLMDILQQGNPDAERISVTPPFSPLSRDKPDKKQILDTLKSCLELNWLSSDHTEQTLQTAKKALESPHNYAPSWKDDGLTPSQRAEALALRYPYTGHDYTDKAFMEISEAGPDIVTAAKAYALPPQAVAAAIVDEWSTSKGIKGNIDQAQRWWAKLGMSLDEVSEEFTVNKRLELADSYQRYISSAYQDIGPGNFKVRSGLRLFEHLALDRTDSNPLAAYLHRFVSKNAPAAVQWEMFKRKMMLEPQGLAYLTAAEMAEGRKLLAPFMRGASPEEQAAILVTWYKQGPFYLKRYLEQRGKEALSASLGVWGTAMENAGAGERERKQKADVPVWPDIQPGEGTGCLKYWDKLTEILGLK